MDLLGCKSSQSSFSHTNSLITLKHEDHKLGNEIQSKDESFGLLNRIKNKKLNREQLEFLRKEISTSGSSMAMIS